MIRALVALAVGALGAGCTDEVERPIAAPLVDGPHETCAAIDICRPCDPQDFTLGPDGTNRCGFTLRYREVAKMGSEPIAYQGADTTTTWAVIGANPDGSPIVQTTPLTGEPAFDAIHRIAHWDDHFRAFSTDPPIGEWVDARTQDFDYVGDATDKAVIPATDSGDQPLRLPITRCGDQGMTVEVTWPHQAEGPITDCNCERILRETARRYAEYHHLDRHVVQVSSFSYAPSQYLRDDYAGQPLRAPQKRRIIRATDGPKAPAVAEQSGVYTITLHTLHPQTVKSDANVFAADKAIIGFRAYRKNRESLLSTHTYFTRQAARADAPKDRKGRIIHPVDGDVIVGSGPLAGVLASHLGKDAVVIDDGEKRHLHRNNTRIIQDKDDVSWARHLGDQKPSDFAEAKEMVGEGPLRHVHVGMAAEQLFDGKSMVPGKITKIETVDGEVHLELKVDNINETFVVHVPRTKRVWVLTGPPETEPANYEPDTTIPAGDAAKLARYKVNTVGAVGEFISDKVHTNNEWYDLPHDEIRARVNNRHIFVFGTGGGGLQALGQITDGAGGEGEVARAKKVTVASFDGGVFVAGLDPATRPGGGQANAYKALKQLGGVREDDPDLRPTNDNVIYGHRVVGAKRQAPVIMDKVSVELHDPNDGTGERAMLTFKLKRPNLKPGEPGLPDVEIYADEVIWSLPGPGKSDLELDAAVIKSFTIAMDGQVPLGASALDGKVRFVASNATAGILAKLATVNDAKPDAGTIGELGDRYAKALEAMRGKAVHGALVDKNSQNEGTLMNQMRYVPLFAGWSPP